MVQDCIYCADDGRLENLMIEIDKLRVSRVLLFREQTYKGRCVVALNEHQKELFHLSQEVQDDYMRDVAQVARAVEQAFSADKINYGAFGDNMPHVHFHIVPKQKNGPEWGTMFEMNPSANKQLTKEEYQDIIDQIKSHL
ncbi:HIT family protein [Paenibacillus macquariensis]|uniref:Diadenosine tetraphosphate (Ap4A) hydrolase n=1 Tax=Paenibacillus macquariensis TaxID=948756 RepID=A0ABY1JN59_9BACL|nr:HIT family protein [Paenibacillus macquariensis]MEC0092225.1 HIT family protein [Paenibacillus macquariensis]SIQ48424.1 Diadenosine tetraphosphate (Ap4A) hydrolase [Paenibacillus macquariensis]